MKNLLLEDILKRDYNEWGECNFKKLSEIKQKIIIILLYNFMRTHHIKRYESAYTALYNALEPGNDIINALVKSIEKNINNINNIDLNILFNVIINNKFNISDISQLSKYSEYQKQNFETYKKIELWKKREFILQHYFNMSVYEANNLLKKYGANKELVSKFPSFFDDILMILDLSYSNDTNDLNEIGKKIKSQNDFLITCNYHSMDLKLKKEYGGMLKKRLFSISDAVRLNEIQKTKIRKILQIKGIFDEKIIEEIYQIPYNSNGTKQPFTMLLKGIRYVGGEFGDYSTMWKEKKFNSVSCINDKMISLFALSKFYLAYNIEDCNLCLASTKDGGSDNVGLEYLFNGQMSDERYLDIEDFIFETVRWNFNDYGGRENVTYSYNEIVIDKCTPSFIVCLKIDDKIKDFDEAIEARNKFMKNGLKLPILIIDMDECLKTQIHNIVNKYIEHISLNGINESFEKVLEKNDEIKRLYIESLATITFMDYQHVINLKDKINEKISTNTNRKHK